MRGATPFVPIYFDTVFPPPEPLTGPAPSTYRRWIDEATSAASAPTGPNRLALQATDPDSIGRSELLDAGLCVGGPEDIIRVVRAYEDAGVDQVAFAFGHGMNIPLDIVLESIRTIGERVIVHCR